MPANVPSPIGAHAEALKIELPDTAVETLSKIYSALAIQGVNTNEAEVTLDDGILFISVPVPSVQLAKKIEKRETVTPQKDRANSYVVPINDDVPVTLDMILDFVDRHKITKKEMAQRLGYQHSSILASWQRAGKVPLGAQERARRLLAREEFSN